MSRALHRAGGWLADRTGYSRAIKPLLYHLVPDTGWDYTLGSATLAAFVVQIVTGVALAFTYVPSPDNAYESLAFITDEAVLGSVIRGIHFWGASAMVLLVCLHCAQVFLIGAFKFPREVNWLSGALLLLFVFGMAFTGQLLRWNQDAYWAVYVAAAQAERQPLIGDFLAQVVFAGQTVGGATLTRFYASHVFVIPAVMFGLLAMHLFLVVFNGVSDPPVAGEPVDPETYRERYEEGLRKTGVPFWPDAGWKDVVFALAVGAVVVGLAIAVGPPPLGPKADPTVVRADPRPDWYLLWYFALLSLIPAGLENWFIVGFPLAVGLLFLLLPFLAPTGERSFRRRPWAVGIVGLVAVSIPVLVAEGMAAPWSPSQVNPPLPADVTAQLGPVASAGARQFELRGCVNCHTIAGVGGQRGPELTRIGAALSPDQLTWRILNGGTNMPAYGGTLSPDQVDELVAFLSSLGR